MPTKSELRYQRLLNYLLSMPDGQNTTLNKANKTSESLRTTVPSSIVKHYRLSEGDRLNWDFEARNDNIIVVVKPAKEETKK